MITKATQDLDFAVALDWRDAFGAHLSRSRAPKTVHAYLRDVALFGTWFEAENREPFQVTSVSGVDLRAYARLRMQSVKPKTWNRQRIALKVFCDWLLAEGHVLVDPFQDVPSMDEVELPPRWMSEPDFRRLAREIERMVNAAHTDAWRVQAWRDRAMVSLMLYAGLRESDVVGLDLSDVEIGERSGRLTVRHGKGNKRRVVPLGPEARRALAGWLAVRSGGGNALFPGKRSEQRISTRQVQRRVAAIGQACGLDVTPHDLRHTFAHRYLEMHENSAKAVKMLQKILGHKSMNTTWRYAQPSVDDFDLSMEGF